jgi:hypothetical protein
VNLPDALRGPVADYRENIYSSPIKTSAGDVHFGGEGVDNYFAHTRVEDLPTISDKYPNAAFDGRGLVNRQTGELYVPIKDRATHDKYSAMFDEGGTTRRVIEVQSDLFQKGRLENEGLTKANATPAALLEHATEAQKKEWLSFREKNVQNALTDTEKSRWGALEAELYQKARTARRAGLEKLEPYRNTWWERIVREEVKQAATDGKTKLQFPTGETAMKIEGLGTRDSFVRVRDGRPDYSSPLAHEELQAGAEVVQQGNAGGASSWIITEVLGDGKFKAVQKHSVFPNETGYLSADLGYKPAPNKDNWVYKESDAEEFDISGKVDTDNPIYKFYEKDIGKFLTKMGATRVTDERGVQWWELPVDQAKATEPVLAYGKTNVGTLLAGGAAATAAAVAGSKNVTVYEKAPKAEAAGDDTRRETIRTGIVYAENRGALQGGGDLYRVVGVSGDLGKYQVNPQVLSDWSPAWLGKKYTKEEFLNDPDAQERFFDEFLNLADKYNLTPEEAAVTWHRGWGELGTGPRETREQRFREKLKQMMESDPGKKYLEQFLIGIEGTSTP